MLHHERLLGQRRCFPLALVAIALTTVAGCSGDGGAAGSGNTPPDASRSNESLRTLIGERLTSVDVRTAIEARRLEAEAQCIEAQGFEVVRPDTQLLHDVIAADSAFEIARYGIPAAFAGDLGIVTAADLNTRSDGALAIQPARDYGHEFSVAAVGDLANAGSFVQFETRLGTLRFDADGCVAKSYLEVIGDPSAIRAYTQTRNEVQSDVNQHLDQLPAVVRAHQLWSECANTRGRDLASPAAAATQITDTYHRDGREAASKLETELVELMRGCEQESGLLATIRREQPSVEREVLRASATDIEALDEMIQHAQLSPHP